MNHTEKNKTTPKNFTRKRCPRGERWNTKENKCKPHIDIQVVPKHKFLDCSKYYVPTTPNEIQRMNDLKEQLKSRKINTNDLRNMVSDLIGEERGINKNQILGARLSDELIRLIICLEGKVISDSKSTHIESPTEQEQPATESTVESSIDQEQPATESTVESSIDQEQSSDESIVESLTKQDSDKVDINIELNPEEQIMQNNIGIEPSDIDSKEHNKYLFDKEKIEYTHNTQDNSFDFLYPDLNDPDFNAKIASRKEFNDTKFDGKVKDIKKQAEILCKSDFELLPHQMFVKNFLSLQTPYNSLLLYHGLGTGKTCSAIGVAEEMRSFMKQV